MDLLGYNMVIKEAEEAINILSKAEEPTFWMDFVRCALENVLALLKEREELLHKKQKDVDRLCNEISEWKHKFHDTLKEQDAVKPKYNARTNWYECGNCRYSMTSGMHCRSELIPATKVRYCANCGFPVNWKGR